MNEVIKWLIEGPPWVEYLTRIGLLGQQESDPEVATARHRMLIQPEIKNLLSELSEWPGPALKRHNDAGHLLHKLVVISDLGIRVGDTGVDRIIKRILENQSQDGAFQITANISPQYGGSGRDQLVWMLCDTPSILYSMVKLGMREHPAIHSAARHLVSLGTDNGWPCVVASELGKFRGPGRKTDPCPYATLIALKALAQIPEWRDSKPSIRSSTDTLLKLWEQRKERRPYMFAMGTDFAKLKTPMVWYDILHVLEVLTQFPHLVKDARLIEMVNIMKIKADEQEYFTSESTRKAWSNWEFGQKKAPSYLLTLQVHRILKRITGLSLY